MKFLAGEYDIVVIGAGHAGCEAALAAARLGMRTCIFSINLDSIANMPCNPSIGGTAKGHLVREIDALGGEMGKAADRNLIQSKMLNIAKGPAVHSLRAQIDRRAYQEDMKSVLEKQENLDIKQSEIVSIIVERNEIKGVETITGAFYITKAAILASGTYLKGKIIIGDFSYESGPDGLHSAKHLSKSLIENGIELMRFKTGTPPRLNSRSIDYSKMEIQNGDEEIVPFSFETEEIKIEQIPCYLNYTNEETHEIIKENLERSPLFSGDIEGVGPRYCPSIEDKVVRFSDKERHQVFLEPMGLNTQEIYLQGMSSSLPEDVQNDMFKSIPGLSDVCVMRSAYAIEYDCVNPLQLKNTLEFKELRGLYSAGQSNGSSGYEEAAAQGLIAGINSARSISGEEPVVLDRSQAYIGVLIDDLVTKGTQEPYRMMTSRAEYRLLLRQDNADRRLTDTGYEIGLISKERYTKYIEKYKAIDKEIKRLKKTVIKPGNANERLSALISQEIKTGIHASELLKRPELRYDDILNMAGLDNGLSKDIKEQVEILLKYEGYIKKQLEQVEKFKKMEEKKLPGDIDYNQLKGLRIEARQKLTKLRPASLGQASRISGVSPADISVLLIYLKGNS
jgi:tRNA uridine 5-carboxymethylaminomethyl modification enzyme